MTLNLSPKIIDGWAHVPIDTFRNAARDISFDVYLKISDDHYAHVFSRATGLDYKRLANYIVKGVDHFCIKAEDIPAYQEFFSRSAIQIFRDPKTSPEKKIATLLNMTEQNLAELFSQVSVRDDTAKSAQELVGNYIELMKNNPHTLAIILKLVAHGEYLYYHSIAVAIFSMFIAKATGNFNDKMLEIVGLGGFLHDIGCTQLSDEVVNSPTDLTEEQWEKMHEHTRIGLKMLENTPSIPDEVRYIVYQHHEIPSGQGYPNRMRGSSIYFPAKIVGVADAFSALISKRPFRPAYSVEQAVQILTQEAWKHDPTLVAILRAVLMREKGTQGTAA